MTTKQPKRDGLGNPIELMADYYVQDARRNTTVGNCVLWWGVDSQGYCCDIDQAGTYKGADVMRMRDTDVPWPAGLVLATSVRHCRIEPLQRAAYNTKQARIAAGDAK